MDIDDDEPDANPPSDVNSCVNGTFSFTFS